MSEDYEDLFTSPEWRAYAEHTVQTTVPALQDSGIFVSMGNPEDPDVRMATELGFAILLGKPLVFVVATDAVVPPALAKIADEIIYGEIHHPKVQAQFKAAVERINKELDEAGEG